MRNSNNQEGGENNVPIPIRCRAEEIMVHISSLYGLTNIYRNSGSRHAVSNFTDVAGEPAYESIQRVTHEIRAG